MDIIPFLSISFSIRRVVAIEKFQLLRTIIISWRMIIEEQKKDS